MIFWILRTVHIFFGILWAGYGIFGGILLFPALKKMKAGAIPLMAQLMQRKLSVYVAASAGLCVLSGLCLYAMDCSGDWLKTSTGLLLSLGALSALAAFAYGIAVIKPSAEKMANLGASRHSELASLSQRMDKAGKIAALLLILSALCMAASRFAPQF